MWQLMVIILLIGSALGVLLYLFFYLVIMAVKRLKERKCGLHICGLCDVKNLCDWRKK